MVIHLIEKKKNCQIKFLDRWKISCDSGFGRNGDNLSAHRQGMDHDPF